MRSWLARTNPPLLLHASPIIATVGCAEREIPVDSNVKQPKPRILAAPAAPEFCEGETL